MAALDRLIATMVPLLPRGIVRRVSARYSAGESLAEVTAIVEDLNRRGRLATVDVLGEFVDRLEGVPATTEQYVQVLEVIRERSLDANISIKLTALGLQVDPQFCRKQVRRIVERAMALGNFVRIDMEDATCTDDTLAVFREFQDEHENVGIVLQAYLRRTLNDARALGQKAANFRLCKGIYVEPKRIAWKEPDAIRDNYVRALEVMLDAKSYVGIATHDETLVWRAMDMIRRRGLDPTEYEFQMLLGVDPDLEQVILDGGHRLRIYVPYGKAWYSYATRRLRENPAIAGYVFKNLLTMLSGRARLGRGPLERSKS